MEPLDYNLLFRWFVGLNMDDAIWDATVFTKNRQRLLDGDIADAPVAQRLARVSPDGSPTATPRPSPMPACLS